MPFPSCPIQQPSFPHRYFRFKTFAACTIVGTAAVATALLFPSHNLPVFVPVGAAIVVLGALVWLHSQLLRWLGEQVLGTKLSLADRDCELRSFFDDAFDAILILDDQLTCREANPAAAQLLGVDQHRLVGRSMKELVANPVSICCLRKKMPGGTPHHGRLELARTDGTRVASEFSFRTYPGGHHLLTLRDETVLARARKANERSLAVARAGILEAHLLHRTTIALSQVGPLNVVLDNLLDILHTAIPCENARILVFEGPTRLFLARQKSWPNGGETHAPCSDTIDLGAFPLLGRLLEEPNGILLHDMGVTDGRNGSSLGISSPCWLGVPLYTGERALGFLILTHSSAGFLTSEHLRLAATIASPLALAVCNARLLERAEIFRAQLTHLVSDLPVV